MSKSNLNLVVSTLVVMLLSSAITLGETPLSTVFTYQGELSNGGAPVDEPLDGCAFKFTLWDAVVDGSQVGPMLTPSALVSEGRFTVALNFGDDMFTGEARFLEIAVCCPAACGDFTTLVPRQELTAAPYALHTPSAESAPWSGLTGVPAGFADDVDDDALSGLSCANGQLAKWIGAQWQCGEDIDTNTDTLAALSCAIGEIAKWNGAQWQCVADDTAGKVVYTRWGKWGCPSGSEIAYFGWAAGSHYNHGGGVSTLCVSMDPTWDMFHDGNQDGNVLYGTEYQTAGYGIIEFTGLNNLETPCSVCMTTGRSVVMMVPGTQVCPENWSLEYAGYLMSTHYTQGSSDTVCVDRNASATGNSASAGGNLLFPTEAGCGSLPCPPYVQDREITCSVCSRP